ncbi:MAG: hypothetical protein VX473_02780 [Candidatus Thermoplasmatota archaeon]|nr:hypothetical protein [Candidatus Thermoplasmatota archaeon]
MVDDGGRFKSRVAALRERGFDVDVPTGDLASEEMLRMEQQADRAAKIRSKVLDLPEHREQERQKFLSQLSDPMEASAVEIELSGLLRRHRPWVMVAERSRVKWSDEGRSVELTHILERLDAIDDGIVMGSPRLLSMIEDVSSSRDIEPVISEIERRQERRFVALQGMIEMLDERGWNVNGIQSGQMHEQFAEADRLHSLDVQLSQCQRQIENEIRPFGHNIAERMWGALTLAQKEASESAMQETKDEIQNVSDDLAKRHAHVEGRISAWQSEGFQITAKLPLLASEMISWEAKLPEISDLIEATHGVWAQMEPHLDQWPEYRRLAERTRGHLDAIQALDVLLQGLTSKTEGARLACSLRLEEWSKWGIDTKTWDSLYESEPRAILEELDSHQSFIDVLTPLIDDLISLDTSVTGGPEVEKWLEKLRSSSAGMDVVEGAKDWLELATNRSIRHRAFLDRARMDLATLWPEELDSEIMDLAMYETTVSKLESGEDLPSSLKISQPPIEVDERLTHVMQGFEGELDDWRHLGWSVDGLYELLAKDPLRLGLDLPDIRDAMESHDARIARLEPLPWALDVNLAERVLSDLMRPERLSALDDEYQDLMLALSNAEGEGDPDFEFKPFRPQMPMARIEAKRAVLIPIVEEEITEIEEEIEDEPSPSVVVEEDEPLIEEEPIQIITEKEVVANPIQSIVRDLFGLGEDDSSLEKLLEPPLDVRVQRLARIAILLEKGNTGEHRSLQERLPAIARKLETWTSERLSRRHASSGNGLLNDARALGERLADIPGPGAAMPLEKDLFSLPDMNDLEGLSSAIKRLERSVMLPSAMMQTAEPVES